MRSSLFFFLMYVLSVVSNKDDKLYLYEGEIEHKDFNPVQDLLVDSNHGSKPLALDDDDEGEGEDISKKKKKVVLPEILTDQATKNRVVEFYAPWCPHCQEFRYHYIDFARNCSALAKTYGIDVDFHAISCTAHKKVCKKEDVKRYPTIRLYRAGSANFTEVKFFEVHCFTALRAFGLEIDDDDEEEDNSYNSNKKGVTTTTTAMAANNNKNLRKQNSIVSQKDSSKGKNADVSRYRHDGRTKSQILNDAFLSFDFAMRESIFMNEGALGNKTRLVFEDWINLLEDALPPFWKIHNALESIKSNMGKVVEDEDNLIEIMDHDGPSQKSKWHGCTNEDSHGYTCGLWELFHIVTVGVVEWNSAAVTPMGVFTAEEVADLLASYVTEFFACEVCRRNFLSNFEACSQDRCHRLGSSQESEKEWKQLPLWLWEEHNDVNIRLKREKKEREQGGIEVQLSSEETWDARWPSRYDCPACWHDDGTWDDEIIYKYLRIKYWPIEDAKNVQYAKEIQQHNAHHVSHRLDDDFLDRKDAEEDDEVEEETDARFLIGIPALGLITLVVAIIRKQIQLDRTGRHKKIDL